MSKLFADTEWLNTYNLKYPEYKNNYDRIYQQFLLRSSKQRKPGFKTFFGQGLACLTHHVSKEKLEKIKKNVAHVLVITGNKDLLIDYKCSEYLADCFGCEAVVIDGKGHGIHIEAEDQVNKYIYNHINTAEFIEINNIK